MIFDFAKSPNYLSKDISLVRWIAERTNSLPSFKSSSRKRVCGSLFCVAQEHHRAIVDLLQHNNATSAFTLCRPLFEAYIRGLWFTYCATENSVKKFASGGEGPRLSEILPAVEKVDAFKRGTLSRLKKNGWRAMCDYAHTGALQVQRWNTENAIEPNYSLGEIEEVLNISGSISLLALVGLLSVPDESSIRNSQLIEETIAKISEFASQGSRI